MQPINNTMRNADTNHAKMLIKKFDAALNMTNPIKKFFQENLQKITLHCGAFTLKHDMFDGHEC